MARTASEAAAAKGKGKAPDRSPSRTSNEESPVSARSRHRYLFDDEVSQFCDDGTIIIKANSPERTLNVYIKQEIAKYQVSNLFGEELWNKFCDNFNAFELDTFKRADKLPLFELRDFLYDRGVHTTKDRKLVAQHLYDLSTRDSFKSWPKEIDKPLILTYHENNQRRGTEPVTAVTDQELERARYEAIQEKLREQEMARRDTREKEKNLVKAAQQPPVPTLNIGLRPLTLGRQDSRFPLPQTPIQTQAPTPDTRQQLRFQDTAEAEDFYRLSPLQNRSSPRLQAAQQREARPQAQHAQATRGFLDPQMPVQDVENLNFGNPVPDQNAFSTMGAATINAPATFKELDGYQPNNYTKELTNLSKMYSMDQKYSGINDNFRHKLEIFTTHCANAGVPREGMKAAVTYMLKDDALEYYFANKAKASIMSLQQICAAIQANFEGKEYNTNMLMEWNAITLEKVVAENKEKKLLECFTILANKLRTLQHGLDPELKTERFFYTKIITSCEGVPACEIACRKPADTLPGLLNDMRSATASYDRIHPPIYETLFTDRKYYGQNRYGRQDRPERTRFPTRGTPNQSSTRPFRPQFSRGQAQAGGRIKRCFVCRKVGCWSKNHTPEERQKFTETYIHEAEGDEEEARDAEEHIQEEEKEEEPEEYGEIYTINAGEVNGRDTVEKLLSHSTMHAITRDVGRTVDVAKPVVNIEQFTTRYGQEEFHGVLIDTGAAFKSTAGMNQLKALQRIDKEIEIDRTKEGGSTIRFGLGDSTSIGTIEMATPIGAITFHIVEVDIPFILSIYDLDRLGYYLNNIQNLLVGPEKEVPVIRAFGHAFMIWGEHLSTFVTSVFIGEPEVKLSELQLRQLHRRFGHPSAQRLAAVLSRADHEFDLKAIEKLTKYCKQCQLYSKAPGRFKFALKDETLQFNYSIVIDIFYLEFKSIKYPVLHVVDEATRFQAARFLRDISTRTVWNELRSMWIDTYIGPPDFVTHDAGTQFTSREFTLITKSIAIAAKCVPVEAHNSIGQVERYHAPLRRAFDIIAEDLQGVQREHVLQMAVKAINDTVGPDGLIPTLLVFGTYPRMVDTDTSPPINQRALAIKNAMEEVRQLQIKRQISDALNERNGPSTNDMLNTPIGGRVLVWRENNRWNGPYQLLSIKDQTCEVSLPSGPTSFRITSVKRFFEEETDQAQSGVEAIHAEHQEAIHAEPRPQATTAAHPELKLNYHGRFPRTRRLPSRYREVEEELKQATSGRPNNGDGEVFYDSRLFDNRYRKATAQTSPRLIPEALLTTKEQEHIAKAIDLRKQGLRRSSKPPFVESREKEIDGLLEQGTFEFTTDIPRGVRLFGSRFVDEIKYREGHPYEKSRLVVQAYNDTDKRDVLTQSPTIQRSSQRLIICMAISFNFGLYIRDISQAYVQSTSELARTFYAKPPEELKADVGGSLLKILRPLYGLPEAGTHWYRTYSDHHHQKLQLTHSTYDPCLFFSTSTSCKAIVGLQTDDTLFMANGAYIKLEQEELDKAGYLAKGIEKLTPEKSLQFNGGMITYDDGSIKLTQERQSQKIELVNIDSTDLKGEYVRQRARGAYIASLSQPEVAFNLSFAAQSPNPTKADAKYLNKRLKWQMQNLNRGLKFITLKVVPEELKLLVFVDASFANNKDLSSQIGYVIVLANESRDSTNSNTIDIKGNILQWSSVKCKRITRSVLASELYAMVAGFDMGTSLQSTINSILDGINHTHGARVPLILCTDSYSLYDCMVKLGTTAEKRLMIDIMGLRQSYERREIEEVRWIDGGCNPADSMTKDQPSQALCGLIDTNTLRLNTKGWVERI